MDLYFTPGSAPCRAVLMGARALGVNLNLKMMNLASGDQFKADFMRINPQGIIPTLVDNGFALWESRAILIYLTETYGKDDSLYPKCPKKRALINQRLFFDMGYMYRSYADYFYPQLFYKQSANPESLQKVESAFELMNTFLEGQTYVAGDTLTLADIALLATISTYEITLFDFSKYKNVSRWYENAKMVTIGYDENWMYCLKVKKFFQKLKR